MSFGEEDPDDGLSFTARIEEYEKLKNKNEDKQKWSSLEDYYP